MKNRYTRAEHSWGLYDWAESAFSIIITTAFFPIYYSSVAEVSGLGDGTDLGLDVTDLLVVLLVVQIVAAPFAIL